MTESRMERQRMGVRRFFRSPKGLLIAVLGGLLLVAMASVGMRLSLPGVAAAIIGAAGSDLLILHRRKGRWVVPDGALLTGMIVAMVLSPHEPWPVTGITAVIAVLSKYLLRSGTANIFNPAAVALVATFYLFDTGQSWWGALPEASPWAILLLLGAGLFIAARVNKLPATLAFLCAYYLLATTAAFLGDPGHVAELYRAPDLHAALYFTFFMVTDPPTSPPKPRDQAIFGAITGVVGYAVFELLGAACYLLIGLLAANAWEAWRRRRERALRRAPA